MKAGKVYLIGAGPGDPGLITCKGLECLVKADIVIYDHLVDQHLLDCAPKKARKIYVGKTYFGHTKEQPDINQLLVKKAQEGKCIIRLKGGDPFVFGRGGEEAEILAANNVPFEIVPGVSSATAVPAYAGIPVTHRKIASSFAVVTGHEDPDKSKSSIDWKKLSTGVDTVVFLMAMHNLPEIVAKLVKYGRPATTPVAVIKDGTQPAQITVTGTLRNIVKKVKKGQLSPPAVVIVGKVVNLRKKLRWFDNRPLSGKRILVTRARHQASALSRLLSERGAEPIELPVIDIQPVTDTSKFIRITANLARYQWIIFTSVNGVEAFFKHLHSTKRDTRALGGLKIGAIGPATAAALGQEGISPDLCPDVFTSEGIIASLRKMDIRGQRFLLPRADIADKGLTKAIRQLGGIVQDFAVYRTVPVRDTSAKIRKVLASDKIDVITFTSSSTVSNTVAVLRNAKTALRGIKVACIGPKTANAAIEAGLTVDIIARVQTIPGLVTAIEEYFQKGGINEYLP